MGLSLRICIYSLPEWRELLARAGLSLIHALADMKLPLDCDPAVTYGRDHYDNLVIFGQKA